MRFARYLYPLLIAIFITTLLCGCFVRKPVETETTTSATPHTTTSTEGTTQTTLSKGQLAAGDMFEALIKAIQKGSFPDFFRGVLPDFPEVEEYFSLDATVGGMLDVAGTDEELASLLRDFSVNISAAGNFNSFAATLGFGFDGVKAFDMEVKSDTSDVFLMLKDIYPKTIKLTPADYGQSADAESSETVGYAEGLKAFLGITYAKELASFVGGALAGSFELVELHSLKTEEEGSLLTVTIPRDMAAKIISRMGELLKSDAGALAALDRAYANMVFAMAGGDGASKPSETLRAMADRLAADQGSAVTGDAEIRAKMSGGRFDRLDITFELYGEAFEFSYLDGAENESGESYIYLGGDIPSFGEFLLYFGALTLEDDNIAHTLNIEFYDDRGGATMLQLLTNTAPGKDGATKTGAQLMAYLGKKSISCNMALEWKRSEDGKRITLGLEITDIIVTDDAEETVAEGSLSFSFGYGENPEFFLVLPTDGVIAYSDFISNESELTRFFEGVIDNSYLNTIAKLLWGK